MIDQATELRRLIAGRARADLSTGSARPQIVMLAGGSAGVGVSTLASALAFELAADAQRVVLADCDLQRADLARRCGADAAINLGDVLAQKRTIHEALVRGPAGMHLLAGSPHATARQIVTERSVRRFLQQLHSLGQHAEWVIVDAGSEANVLTIQLAASAAPLWIVSSPEPAAIMDSYVLIKTLCAALRRASGIGLVVTRADQQTAEDVHGRINRSCRRFLGLTVELAGWLAPHSSAAMSVDGAARENAERSAAVQRLIERLEQVAVTVPTRFAA
jgi:flagellar biosynthesis protein FlhG